MKSKYLILACGAAFVWWALKKQIAAEKAVIAAGSDYRSTGLYPNYNTTPQMEWASRLPIEDDGTRVFI